VVFPPEIPALLQRLYASRGVRGAEELERSVKGMLPWSQLTGVEAAVRLLHEALRQRLHIMVVGDFDADGATSTALSVLALRDLGGHRVDFLVPNRFDDGYGLSPEVVEQAHARGAQLIMMMTGENIAPLLFAAWPENRAGRQLPNVARRKVNRSELNCYQTGARRP